MDFIKVAEGMIEVGDHVDTAKRYLSIRRREKIVEAAVAEIRPSPDMDWSAFSAILEGDPDRGIQRLPACSNRLALQRRWYERQIQQVASKARFSAVIAKDEAMKVLERIPKAIDKMSLVIACSDKGLVIEGHPVPTAWKRGNGLAVIHRTDFAQLMEACEYGVTIEAFEDHWQGWVDATPAGRPKNLPEMLRTKHVTFAYFQND